MAKKIIGGLGGILGIGGSKKKSAASTTTGTEQKGPIVTRLGPDISQDLRRRLAGGGVSRTPARRTTPGVGLVNTTGKLGA